MYNGEFYPIRKISEGLGVDISTANTYLARPEFNKFMNEFKRGRKIIRYYQWCKSLVSLFNEVYFIKRGKKYERG